MDPICALADLMKGLYFPLLIGLMLYYKPKKPDGKLNWLDKIIVIIALTAVAVAAVGYSFGCLAVEAYA